MHGAIFIVQTLINAVPLFGTSEFMLWDIVLIFVKKSNFFKVKIFRVFLENEANMKAKLYTSGHVITKQTQKKDKLNLR